MKRKRKYVILLVLLTAMTLVWYGFYNRVILFDFKWFSTQNTQEFQQSETEFLADESYRQAFWAELPDSLVSLAKAPKPWRT
jgi:hypothetical protein